MTVICNFTHVFFRPYPERVSQKYPIDTSKECGLKLNNRPDFDLILRDVLTECPNAQDPLRLARDRYDEVMSLAGPQEWRTHAQEIQYYMYRQHWAHRKGLPRCTSLIDLGSLTVRR